jgi:putative hemolysin
MATDVERSPADVSFRRFARLTSGDSGEEVIGEVPQAALRAEIEALDDWQALVSSGELRVYCARARSIPHVLREIGRLRELTFRAAGEGTGKCADIDSFDAFYLHLFVWDARAEAVVGAYRLGLVDEILAAHGKRGLYTYSLFRYPPRILTELRQAIELGRSFVRSEYQRSYAPLLLLWRGIGQVIERAPQYATLFGSVSISSAYSAESRRLMVSYLSSYRADTSALSRVTPRRPYRDRASASRSVTAPRTIEELSGLVAEIEPDRKGVPVLLKHYLRLGGRIVAFTVDREFGNTLDALVTVNLRQTEPSLLERYMSESGVRAFRAYHALGDGRVPMKASSSSSAGPRR